MTMPAPDGRSTAGATRWDNPVLAGARVTLRPIVVEDAPAMWEMVNDPEGNVLTDTTATFSYDQIVEWCRSRDRQHDRIDVAIVEKATGEYAGEAVLNEYDSTRNSANFRISLRGPAWYGRGLGTQATRLLVDHGVRHVGLDTITLELLERNLRARRAYAHAGFAATGSHVDDGKHWVEMTISKDVTPEAGRRGVAP